MEKVIKFSFKSDSSFGAIPLSQGRRATGIPVAGNFGAREILEPRTGMDILEQIKSLPITSFAIDKKFTRKIFASNNVEVYPGQRLDLLGLLKEFSKGVAVPEDGSKEKEIVRLLGILDRQYGGFTTPKKSADDNFKELCAILGSFIEGEVAGDEIHINISPEILEKFLRIAPFVLLSIDDGTYMNGYVLTNVLSVREVL